MGMYNEVFCRCPNCNGQGYMQISQIVLGFGEFDLNYTESLSELSNDQLIELKSAVMKKKFECRKCGQNFNPYKNKEEKSALIKELFSY